MSILTKIFSSSNNKELNSNPIKWNALTQREQLEHIIETSKQKPISIFKHSTRCGISRMVLKQFERNFNLNDDCMDFYFLDILNNREISNEVARIFESLHQSPQLLIIKNEKVVASASHYEINDVTMEQFVD